MAWDFVPGMAEAIGELAVIGQKEQPFSSVVEAPDGGDEKGDLPQLGQVMDGRPLEPILSCRQNFVGLVEHPVDAGRRRVLDELAIKRDLVFARGDLGTHFLQRDAIDGHTALTNPALRLPT